MFCTLNSETGVSLPPMCAMPAKACSTRLQLDGSIGVQQRELRAELIERDGLERA